MFPFSLQTLVLTVTLVAVPVEKKEDPTEQDLEQETRRQEIRARCAAELQRQLECLSGKLLETMTDFLDQPATPARTYLWENRLADLSREANRTLVGWTLNQVEPAAAPGQHEQEGTCYSRVNAKTPNRYVATRFGTITLQRYAYRPTARDSDAPCVFPLEQQLGLVAGVTPALAERVARSSAEAGMSQQRLLQELREEYHVHLGVPRLREVLEEMAGRLDSYRQDCQAARVVELLGVAAASQGRHKPVLCLGRDGITLREKQHGFFEVAGTGTLSVFDRRGRRLGTVYLAYVPEEEQTTLTHALTALLHEVLRRWHGLGGQLPRLCYVTDAGANERSYLRTLRCQRHPVTGQRLDWQWCVDYWHAAERISTLAEALLSDPQESTRWARTMRQVLLQPGGVRRVLNSAAKLRQHRGVRKAKAYRLAYNYLQERIQYMDYARYRRLGIPIGSGVTEAACKTIFTQRLKLSGMGWDYKHCAGAQSILTLRILLLSGTWQAAQQALWADFPNHPEFEKRAYPKRQKISPKGTQGTSTRKKTKKAA